VINIIIINLFILFNIIGYTYLYKRILLKKKNFYIFNLDLIYGIFFITILSIFLNFFLPLKLVTLPFYIIGFFFGIKEFIKKKIFINLFLFLIILISVTIISYNNGENIDSPMYHLQIINWITNYKVSFGISYLEIRYGMNSSWHNFISFFNFSIFSFKSIFFISLILLSIITNEAFNINKKLSISNFFFVFIN